VLAFSKCKNYCHIHDSVLHRTWNVKIVPSVHFGRVSVWCTYIVHFFYVLIRVVVLPVKSISVIWSLLESMGITLLNSVITCLIFSTWFYHLYTVTVRSITNVAWDRNFFLNNQPDAQIIPILFCYKILHVSGIFSAHHQEFSTWHSALVSFMQVSDDRFEAESGLNAVPCGVL